MKETSGGMQSLVKQSRAMTNVLSEKLEKRELECTDLVNYQNEFREEYKRMVDERDRLAIENARMASEITNQAQCLDAERLASHNLRSTLISALTLQPNGPIVDNLIIGKVESLQSDHVRTVRDLQNMENEKNDLDRQVTSQRIMYQAKLKELEEQIETNDKRFREDREEIEELRLEKERSYEQQLESLRVELATIGKNLEVRDRQLTKAERRIEEEKME